MGLPSTFADIEDRQFENGALITGLADGRMMNYPCAGAMTWQTSLTQLSVPARRLLERLVWLAPEDPVPNFLIEVRVPGIADEDVEEALDDLASHSLVLRIPRNQEFRPYFSMSVLDAVIRPLLEHGIGHRVVVEAQLNKLSAGNRCPATVERIS
jgi:hypothetical protein